MTEQPAQRSNIPHLALSHPWLVTFVGLRLFEALLFTVRPPDIRFDIGVYMTGTVISFLGWLFVGLLYSTIDERRSRVHRIGRYAFAAAITLFTVLLAAVSFGVYSHFGEFLTEDTIQYVLGNPTWIAGYLKPVVLSGWSIAAVVYAGGVLALWYPRGLSRRGFARLRQRPRLTLATAILVCFPAYFGFDTVRSHFPLYTTSMDTALAASIERLFTMPNTDDELRVSARIQPEPVEPAADAPQTIILMLYESWGLQELAFYGAQQNPMPALNSWIEREPGQFLVFENAFTNSTTTDVSIPSMMTGVAPWESTDKLHERPLVWDWAKAAGMHTVLVSSKGFSWQHFSRFFFSPGPHDKITRQTEGHPIVNDIGFDEILAASGSTM
jgi:glucan phosphoethanolaminetransferase (alkaline phosphatase superfamily)